MRLTESAAFYIHRCTTVLRDVQIQLFVIIGVIAAESHSKKIMF